jgi:hypothetical protein
MTAAGFESTTSRLFGGDDLQLSVLESERLGINREESYFRGQKEYLDARAPSVAEIATRSYRSHWGERGEVDEGLLDRLDVGARAEWGLSMRELGQIFGALSDIALDSRAAACAAPRSELVDQLSSELRFDPETIERGLGLLTLEPRADFLKVPKPFKLPDIYPWRFNRDLSYLRRPLLLREAKREEQIVWGPRHLEAAGRYLIELMTSERQGQEPGDAETDDRAAPGGDRGFRRGGRSAPARGRHGRPH